jgi:hypothetical protein
MYTLSTAAVVLANTKLGADQSQILLQVLRIRVMSLVTTFLS